MMHKVSTILSDTFAMYNFMEVTYFALPTKPSWDDTDESSYSTGSWWSDDPADSDILLVYTYVQYKTTMTQNQGP